MYARMIGLASALVFTVSANAGVIFEDNFDSEVPDVLVQTGSDTNYTSFTNWTVTNGTVDLVANNDWGLKCAGNTGKCVDLDGSTSNAGVFTSTSLSLAVGTYELSFDISGNQRNRASDDLTVSLGGFFNQDFTLASNVPWQTVSHVLSVTNASSSSFIFNHQGGDNIGIMLDNVSLSTVSVSEPATFALLGLGLLGLGVARKRQAS